MSLPVATLQGLCQALALRVTFGLVLALALALALAVALAFTPTPAAAQLQTAPSTVQAAAPTAPLRAPAVQRQRLALVVGIGQVGSRPVLDSARRDSEAVAAALRAGGFEVLLRTDVTSTELRAALKDFRDRLRADGVGLIYYTGLAAQVDGRNLLLPAEVALNESQAPSAVAALLRAVGLPLQEAADALSGGTEAPRALIVDAAYRHPALARLTPPGLARPRLTPGTMVLLGHAPAALQDVPTMAPPGGPPGDSRDAAAASRFARVLVEALTTPRISVPEALRAIRLSVVDSSGGLTQPWLGGETFAREHLADAVRLDNPTLAATPSTPAPAPAPAGTGAAPMPMAASVPVPTAMAAAPAASASALAAAPASPASPSSAPASTSTATLAPPAPAASAPLPPRPAGAGGLTALAPGRGERPVFQARSNTFGHAEGDTFSYQLMDTRKDELLLSYSLSIDEVRGDGHLAANGGQWQMDPQGRVKRQQAEDGSTSTFEPAQEIWWSRPQAGENRPVAFKETRTGADRTVQQIEWRGTSQVGTLRVVETAAGEFEVLPIKTTGQSSTTTVAGAAAVAGLFTRTVFYAPKLGVPVLIEIEDNDAVGRPLRRERIELTHAQQARTAN